MTPATIINLRLRVLLFSASPGALLHRTPKPGGKAFPLLRSVRAAFVSEAADFFLNASTRALIPSPVGQTCGSALLS